MKKPFTTVSIQCKPIVKEYLQANFGTPVNIPEDHILYNLFCSQLVKKNVRGDKFSDYTQEIEFVINQNQPITSIEVKCTPVVKNFIEGNFSPPVVLKKDEPLYQQLRQQFLKNVPSDQAFIDKVDFVICAKNFAFDGYSISKMNVRIINNATERYIKDILHTAIDAQLINKDLQENWKEKYLSILPGIYKDKLNRSGMASKKIKELKKELQDFEITIKEAINTAITKFLKISPDNMPYETVKKDYYRYRLKKFNPEMSPNKKST